MKNKLNLSFLGLFFIVFVVYLKLFLPGNAIWGDAPFFSSTNLQALVSEPKAWNYQSHGLGGINNLLFLSPIMFLYGLINQVFGFDNQMLIRLVFYFPALIFGSLGTYLLTRYLKFSSISQFFSILIYLINTYIILLIDGGQAGIVLAYGIFPLAVYTLKKFIDTPNFNSFYISLIFLSFLSIADIRVGVLAGISVILWELVNFGSVREISRLTNKIGLVILLALSTLLLGLYWFYPLVVLGNNFQDLSVSSLQLTSLLHSLTLYQPHWPNNDFGQTTYPEVIYLVLPLIAFLGVFTSKRREISMYFILFLIFVFLAKGTTPPLGQLYNWVTNNIPFAVGFRDSTKFFIPLILFYSLVLGLSIHELGISSKIKSFNKYFYIAVAILLIFLVRQTVLGQHNGALSKNYTNEQVLLNKLSQVNQLVRTQDFSRVLWFPEKHPFGEKSESNPSVDAASLASLRPFASLNVGTQDRFNFLNNDLSYDFLKLLGVKHLVLSGNFRKPELNEEEMYAQKNLELLVSGKPHFQQVLDDSPVFSLYEAMPQIYTTTKLVAVIGSENIYSKILDKNKDFKVSSQGFVFIEDGKWDPKFLNDVDPESLVIVLNNKESLDMQMSFLQKYFKSSLKADKSEWALRDSNDYLKWKYEFLLNQVETQEFDYQKGIAFSTKPGEQSEYSLNTAETGDYVFAIRALAKDTGEVLELSLNGEKITVENDKPGNFFWFSKEINTPQRSNKLIITNRSNFSSVNTIALIPKNEWESARDLAKSYLENFQVVQNIESLEKVMPEITEFDQSEPLRFKALVEPNSWIIFTDTYNPLWNIKIGDKELKSLPFYSMINGFYTGRGGTATVYFKGQEDVRWGYYYSVVSALLLTAMYLYRKK